MATASERTELIAFQRASVTANEYNEEEQNSWPTLFSRRARVRFGTSQEKREAAQEGGAQSASFECQRSAEIETVTLSDRISYLGSSWDLTEIAPLDRKTIRFTGVRNL